MRQIWPVILALISPLSALAQFEVDQATLFLARYNGSVDADFARGDWRGSPRLSPVEFVAARAHRGVRLPAGQSIGYPAADNVSLDRGTIEMWFKPEWPGAEGVARSIFSISIDRTNYLNINRIAPSRLGIAMSGGPEGQATWRRVDADVSDWQPGQWHYIAGTWDGAEMRFYVDGREVGRRVADARPMQGALEAFQLVGSGIVVDELRISNRARSPEEVAATASVEPGPLSQVYVSALRPVEVKPSPSAVGADALVRDDGTRIPLLMARKMYARGLGMWPPAEAVYDLGGEFSRLVGSVGLSDVADSGHPGSLRVEGDGRLLFDSTPLSHHGPYALDLDVEGVRRLRLSASGVRGKPSPPIVWADLCLLRAGAPRPPEFARAASETDVTLARMKTTVDRVEFEVPATDRGYFVCPRDYIEDLDVSAPPAVIERVGQVLDAVPEVEAFATPGELEPVAFAVYAGKDLAGVQVSASDLTGPGRIPAENVDVRLVQRCLQRRIYSAPVEQCVVTSRFLRRNRPFSLPAGSVKEVWITVSVPDGAAPGTYHGAITVAPRGLPATTIRVSFEVLPFRLGEAAGRVYGLYYRLGPTLDRPEKARAELRDMRAHGATMLHPSLGISFRRGDDGIEIAYDSIITGLTMMREEGYRGPTPIETRLITLARLLGHTDVGHSGQTGESLDGDPEFAALAKEAIAGLKDVQAQFPEFDIILRHMDEVFNRGRLPLYIRLTKAAQQVPGFRFYQTLHTCGDWEDKMAEIDPYVDVRCYNGHCLDEYIKAGHTWDDLALELRQSGDEGWTYYNLRGPFVTPKWVRIINGLYMWWSPLKAHCPWIYHSYRGDPFDDTDGPRVGGCDYGFAFPSPDDGITPVPTRHWEAFREGIDDLRYISTLEQEVARVKRIAPDECAAAERWLRTLRDLMPAADVVQAIDEESPILVAVSRETSGGGLQRLRRRTADEIVRLKRIK